jgi:hypothetical protein
VWRVVWIGFLVAACRGAGSPPIVELLDGAPDSPRPPPVVLIFHGGDATAIFQDPAGNTVQDGSLGKWGNVTADLPQGGTVVVLWTIGVNCNENYCGMNYWVVRGVKSGDQITLTESTGQVVPGSPDAVVVTCRMMWGDGLIQWTGDFQVLVEDPSAGPVTIPPLPPRYPAPNSVSRQPLPCPPV